MSKLDKVRLVLEQASQPLSIEKIASLTRFDLDLVSFMVDELKTSGKAKVSPTGEVIWAARSQPMEVMRSRKVI